MIKKNYSEQVLDNLDLNRELLVIQKKCKNMSMPYNLSYRFFKRLFDIVFSLLGLIILSPMLLIVAFAIKIDTKNSVFYKQERVGLDGVLFYIYKFQTMVPNADNIGPQITTYKDPRITKSGYWLRKTKIDELPQLFNFLKGDMSFVGPRPEVPRYVASYSDEALMILKVKPGITDVSSLKMRNEETIIEQISMENPSEENIYLKYVLPNKIKFSLENVKNAGLTQDFVIILETLLAVFFN